MSRVSLIEQLYAPRKKSALEFDYDKLWAPPIRFLLSQQDIDKLYKIATSLRYNDNIEKKYELIDAVMKPRGFKRGNCGTNRVVYNFLEDTSFCMKIALDRVGIQDSPKEYKNQEFFKPFCCKIFEVDPTGVIACVERVNPISSLEEFASIADDVFNMMVTKIIGKYVVDDLGTEKFLNYGIRYNSNGVAFGPVILDYPYAYELDGAKLHCSKPIQIGDKEFACGGEIDYDAGLNNLVCCKCGRTYSARELAKDDSNVLKFYADEEMHRVRARIVRADGTVIKDSGRSSKIYLTKEEYEEGITMFELKNANPRKVGKTINNKRKPSIDVMRREYYSELQTKTYNEMQKRADEKLHSYEDSELAPRSAKRANNSIITEYASKSIDAEAEKEVIVTNAKRAEEGDSNMSTINTEFDNKVEVESEETCVEAQNVNQENIDTLNSMSDRIKLLFNLSDEELTDIFERNNYDPSRVAMELQDRCAIINEDSENEDSDEIKIDTEDNEEVQNAEVEENSSFNAEMESEAFPEINNKEYTSSVDLNNEPDYSNYIPTENDSDDNYDEESDATDNTYSEYFQNDRKAAKRHNKQQQQIRNKKNNANDMSEY
jgi:hypothetical protein